MNYIFSQYDSSRVYDSLIHLVNEMELFYKVAAWVDQLPAQASAAGAKWGEFGWVPLLPQDNIYRFFTSVEVPPTQEEADALMLAQLENTTEELFLAIQKSIEKLDGNQTTFAEAVLCFNMGLYTSCSLDVFALIDHIAITSQKATSDSIRRKTAWKAIYKKYNDSKSAPYLVIAAAVKTIVEVLFKDGEDFNPEKEGSGNRNFISHGMNDIIPDKTFCLKLLVLLYNLCLLYKSGIFSRDEDQ